MWYKIFFQTLKQIKWVNFAGSLRRFWALSLLMVLWISPSFGEEQADANARLLLNTAIETIQSAQSFAVDLRFQIVLLDTEAMGRGTWCQKKISIPSADDAVSFRFEMMYDLKGFQQQEIVVLNGEQKQLWFLQERRKPGEKDGAHSTGMSRVDLRRVEDAYRRAPNHYSSMAPPWFGQPGIDALLKSILDQYDFHIAGRIVSGFQISGTLKPEAAKRVLEVRNHLWFLEKRPLTTVPMEIPTEVMIYLDGETCLPRCIQLNHPSPISEQKTKNLNAADESDESGETEEASETLCTLYFENIYLNNTSQSSRFFEISDSDVSIDATESYIRERRH